MAKRPFRPLQKLLTPAKSVARLQARLLELAADFRAALAKGDYATGRTLAEQALHETPSNMAILSDYALCLMRTGEREQAYQVYMRIYNSPPDRQKQASSTWLDGLAEVCGWLDKRDELRKFGNESLTRADAAFRNGRQWPLPDGSPPAFEPARPEQNVISYSLFGADPRYCESAVANIHAAAELFSGWTCRIYLDDSVPLHVQQRLRDGGADLVQMKRDAGDAIPPVMWRFLVMEDPDVSRFLIRDADALLSEREVPAVQQWLESDRWFHHMRDYFTHTELMLAGMWGGCTGVFPDIATLIRQYVHDYTGPARFVDQYFLRTTFWPTVRNSVLSHDELFDFHGALVFPSHPPIRWRTAKFHVGSNASFQRITGQSGLPDGATESVQLSRGEAGPWTYPAIVRGGQWELNLPFFLVDELSEGRLRVECGGGR
ncbi:MULTISPECIES: tetratricopeptide repeat protein [Burkholderia]|uniref:Tetratricopeptide repeat protein n=1 Tax=Burkholderia pyrrocinia TaxID=60550 RepID=A0A318HY35_BURPY|nr:MULTISPECIES: tetratricopeptide repeat protein [Burkholderia]PXX21580.1 tetratricopeptide repeat protein [Burkholderia pyrrocinia]SFW90382.1 Tetratricopeptide repeat [Burkholderia sp. NFACC33-1]SFY46463.1 Tetratricopeptide repeat [Burkholderia sp. NFPP32]